MGREASGAKEGYRFFPPPLRLRFSHSTMQVHFWSGAPHYTLPQPTWGLMRNSDKKSWKGLKLAKKLKARAVSRQKAGLAFPEASGETRWEWGASSPASIYSAFPSHLSSFRLLLLLPPPLPSEVAGAALPEAAPSALLPPAATWARWSLPGRRGWAERSLLVAPSLHPGPQSPLTGPWPPLR